MNSQDALYGWSSHLLLTHFAEPQTTAHMNLLLSINSLFFALQPQSSTPQSESILQKVSSLTHFPEASGKFPAIPPQVFPSIGGVEVGEGAGLLFRFPK